MNHDKSQIRDRLGYLMFSEMGVPSPRSVHARLVINGQYMGLFALIEQIDDRFAAERFEDYKGNIYKEVWPLDQDGNPMDKASILKKADAYDGSDPDVSVFQQFASEISATDLSKIKELLPKWMDMNEIIAYAAVDRTIRADDGPFHWYCFGGVCKPHNFYWYEKPTSKTIHLLPWDMDNAFQNMTEDKNPVTPIADGWGQITAGCQPFPYGPYKILQRSAACDKLTAGWVQFDELYQLKRAELMAGPFSEANVYKLIDEWSEKIKGATIEAQQTHEDAITVEQWEKALVQLKEDVRVSHVRYRSEQGM
jgi:spore coat protein CotH